MSEIKFHLMRGFGELKKTHVAEIQTIKLERDETVARLEVDRQHFAKLLAESMNENTDLRICHTDCDDGEYGDHEEPEEDELHRWYDAAGVGDLDYSEHGPVLHPVPPPMKPPPSHLGPLTSSQLSIEQRALPRWNIL
ncbi:MAG: hypothetical protein ACKPKO_39185 [Candidatus Fonsibacter sp.]